MAVDEHEQDDEASVEEETPRWKRWLIEAQFRVLLVFLVALLLLLFLWPMVFVTIDAGYRGVMFRRFGGTELGHTWGEGIHIVPPWDRLTIYETRVQSAPIDFNVLTLDGLSISIQLSVRYRPDIDKLPELHQVVGPDYFQRIVVPEIKASIRELVGNHDAYQLYSSEDNLLSRAVAQGIEQVQQRHIILDDLLIEAVELPEVIQASINHKLSEEQAMLEYEYRLDRERQEAERKRIEAEGIRDFQNTIAEGISPGVLRWRGIEATLALAQSENAKVVVIGSGDDGLPIILDATGDDVGAASLPRAAMTPPSDEPAPPAAPAVRTPSGVTALQREAARPRRPTLP